jgi:hypothetical protein
MKLRVIGFSALLVFSACGGEAQGTDGADGGSGTDSGSSTGNDAPDTSMNADDGGTRDQAADTGEGPLTTDAANDASDATDPFIGRACTVDRDCSVHMYSDSPVCCYSAIAGCSAVGRCMAARSPRCASGTMVCGCDGTVKYENGLCKCPDGYSATAYDHSQPVGFGWDGGTCVYEAGSSSDAAAE